MADRPHYASPSTRGSVAAEALQSDVVSSFVVELRAPEVASAYARATWRIRPNIVSTQADTTPPSRGLRGPTSYPEPLPATIDLASRGPAMAPVVSHSSPSSSSHTSRNHDVPDMGHLLIRARTPKPPLARPSFAAREVALGGTITYRSNDPVRGQGYELSISQDILTEEGNYKAYETHLFSVDTGSNDTFAFGTDPDPLNVGTKANSKEWGLEPRIPWTSSVVSSAQSHTGVQHRYDPELSNDELRRIGPVGRIAYADSAIAHLGLLRPRTFVLHGYDWERQRRHQIHLTWEFGVAFAVNEVLLNDSTSGMLGLGLTGIQHAYMNLYDENENVAPADFLTTLAKRLKPIRGALHGEKTVIYFCLRMAPELCWSVVREEIPIQSWMSFNTWPCTREPEWTPEILVRQPDDPINRRWEVRLRSMKFMLVDASVQRPAENSIGFLQDTELNFVNPSRTRGLRALLDTGTSISLFPLDIVQRIYEKLFGGTTTLSAADDLRPDIETFKIPSEHWVLDQTKKIEVVYEFEGLHGRPVTVHGPFETFFYQRNALLPRRPAESLIFPRGPSHRDSAILGLNFFQTMYISMHKTANAFDFVRMAAQWPENLTTDLRKFYIDGLSGVRSRD